MTDLYEIQQALREVLLKQTPPLQARVDTPDQLEMAGTKEVMQGKQKVDGHYFASIIPKAKDIRFYFFPIYTHATEFPPLSDSLKKALKGKSCFHIKKLDQDQLNEISQLVEMGVSFFERDGLI
ncbi:MAG: hypothetical protein R2792_04050 [Saprospiraceae bacterium]